MGGVELVVNLTVCSAGGAGRGSTWSPWMSLSSVAFEKQDPDRWFAELELSGVPGAPFTGAPMPVTHQSAIFGHSSVKRNAHNRERGVWFYYARGCRRAHTRLFGGPRTDTFQTPPIEERSGRTWLRTAL